jgi:hypothetical protein
MEFKTLKEQYIDLVTEKVSINKEDLTETESTIIDIGYNLLVEKLEDIKILKDELRRISIDLANMKVFNADVKNKYCDDSDILDEDCF